MMNLTSIRLSVSLHHYQDTLRRRTIGRKRPLQQLRLQNARRIHLLQLQFDVVKEHQLGQPLHLQSQQRIGSGRGLCVPLIGERVRRYAIPMVKAQVMSSREEYALDIRHDANVSAPEEGIQPEPLHTNRLTIVPVHLYRTHSA